MLTYSAEAADAPGVGALQSTLLPFEIQVDTGYDKFIELDKCYCKSMFEWHCSKRETPARFPSQNVQSLEVAEL